MQCPKCSYEPTMTEMNSSQDKCPSCGVFYAKVRKPDTSSSIADPKVQFTGKVKFTDWLDSNPRAKLVGALLIGLAVGYFAGREHVKYEIKSAFMGTAAGISSAIKSANPFAGIQSADLKPEPIPDKPFPIKARLLGKEFAKRDYQSFMIMKLQFVNETGQKVRAFDGEIVFTDLLGNEILKSALAVNEPVGVGASMNWNGEIKYNEFIGRHQIFKNADAQNMKAEFKLNKVLYQDGRLEEF